MTTERAARGHRALRPHMWAGSAAAALVACNPLWGIDELRFDGPSAGGAGHAGGAGSAAGGAAGAPGTAGEGGSGGQVACAPGSSRPCYTGPPGTEGVGICHSGSQKCNKQGSGYGPCQGDVGPGPEDCNSAADESCDGFACGETMWSRRFGGAAADVAFGVAAAPDGSVLLTGYYTGAVDFGGGALPGDGGSGKPSAFLVKLGAKGQHLWSKGFGDHEVQYARDVAVDAQGNVAVATEARGSIDFGGGALATAGGGDACVAKLDADGHHVWSKCFGDSSEQRAAAVAFDPQGNLLIAGEFSGKLDFGAGPCQNAGGLDIFLAKLAPDGQHLWSKCFGGGYDQFASDLAVDAAGNVLLAGSFNSKLDFGGEQFDADGLDVYVANLGPGGQHLWSRSFSGKGPQTGRAAALDGAGNVWLTGGFFGEINFGGNALVAAGGNDAYLAKLAPGGQHLWSKRFGDAQGQVSHGVAVDGWERAVLAGYFEGAVDLGSGALSAADPTVPNIFVGRLDAAGKCLLARAFDVTGDQLETHVPYSRGQRRVAVDAAGSAVLAGFFSGSLDLGTGVLASAGDVDVFVAKLAP